MLFVILRLLNSITTEALDYAPWLQAVGDTHEQPRVGMAGMIDLQLLVLELAVALDVVQAGMCMA